MTGSTRSLVRRQGYRLAPVSTGIIVDAVAYAIFIVGIIGLLVVLLLDYSTNHGQTGPMPPLDTVALWLWSAYLRTFGFAAYYALWHLPLLTKVVAGRGAEVSYFAAVNFAFLLGAFAWLNRRRGRLWDLFDTFQLGCGIIMMAEIGLYFFDQGEWWGYFVSNFQSNTTWSWFTNFDLFVTSALAMAVCSVLRLIWKDRYSNARR